MFWSHDSQVTGDTMILFTEKQQPKLLQVYYKAMMVNRTREGLFNQMGGRTIHAYFKDGSMDYARVKGSPAESIYYAQDDDIVARFRREAMAATSVGNEHIIEVLDLGTDDDGSLFMVLELLEGRDLGTALKEDGALPVAKAISVAAQICDALAAAHAKGIVHRDMKPDNVFLLEQDGNTDFVKIVDFGIAKQAADGTPPPKLDSPAGGIAITGSGAELRRSPHTLPGTLLGTPGYMSPEQARGTAIDFRVDQYSLGCILFEMLSSTLPFDDDTVGGLLRKHLEVLKGGGLARAAAPFQPPPATESAKPMAEIFLQSQGKLLVLFHAVVATVLWGASTRCCGRAPPRPVRWAPRCAWVKPRRSGPSPRWP